MITPMDKIDQLLESANPVRPPSAPRLDPRAELRAALDGAPGLQASGSDFVGQNRKALPRSRYSRRSFALAVAMAALTVLVIATIALVQLLAPLQPTPPAVSPSPSVSSTEIGSEGWRVVRLSTTQAGYDKGPQIQLDIAPGFTTSSDVPNEGYDSLSIKIVRDTPTQDILAQIYYGKALPQRDPHACVASPENYVELDSTPVDVPANAATPGTAPPRFVYRVVDGSTLKPSLGITSLPPGNAVDSCTEYHHMESFPADTMLIVSDHFQFNGVAAGWLSSSTTSLTPTFATIDEARAYMGTDEYLTFKRMLTSVRIIEPK
ncbi:hypothetical protein VUN82_09320 [Micrococcaceae bacterium Sec5.1]